ncbi:DUF6431 domain-containing protein [Rossellomorea vietnamensis]
MKAFFIKCAEKVPCPCCNHQDFKVIGSRERKLKDERGMARTFIIRRLRCQQCNKIHHELPDLMIPYKRYAADVIEETIFQTAHLTVAADESTIYGWRKWFSTLIDYWLFILQSLLIQFEQNETPTVDLSSRLLPVHKRIGQWFGTASGWLGKIVHPVANHHFWIHTRSAFLSAYP